MPRSDPDDGGFPSRPLLLGVLLLGMVGISAELLLLEHTESVTQWIPLAALGLGCAVAIAAALRPRRATVQFLRGVMVLFLLTGGLGVYLHYRGNVEFEREMYPSMEGLELFWNAMTGATPALAPAAMTWLGLVGLVFTAGHPRLRRDGAAGGPSPGSVEGGEHDT